MAEEALRMSHIVKVYPNGVMANKDVTLSVERGEIHALSGENGAGKSTLMKILFGEEQPTSGEIYVNGKQVHMTSPQMAIKLGIGMVHQHFMLVPSLTVAENIILGMEPKKGIMTDLNFARKQVEEMGKKYNLFVEPDKRVEDLTVGQKQKVEILKALFRGAKILILDEPTAGLDVIARDSILELLREYMETEGRSILISSHISSDLESLCDDIYMIDKGRIVLHENTDVLLDEYGLIKADEKQYELLDKQHILKVKKEQYGYSCLTDERAFYAENYPQLAIERGSVDKVITMMIKGEVL